ncbi:MAG: hypothetical protein HRT58_13255 [Crocinitomicaceae bacterium]|nr:hypothetical protein [Flavobacteriales bacterium]NQZ36631.1 hypothetical protein [Crocinitomicaceae bacterium]
MSQTTFLSFLFTLILSSNLCKAQEDFELQPFVLIVQPIVVQSDEGTDPASMAIPEDLVDRAYSKAGVDFHFLEPIFYNSTQARDGLINLDKIVIDAKQKGILRGQNDIVNMFFVNAVDGQKGPLGRGMFGGDITFIALGEESEVKNDDLKFIQAFVIAHEVGHNLSLNHAVDDPNVPDSIPNIQGDGEYFERIDPMNSLNDYQIGIVHKSPLVHERIEFLSKSKGEKAILDETFEPYFSILQLREISAFTNSEVPYTDVNSAREYAKEKFSMAVTEFTLDEKECISYVVTEINKILIKNNIGMMANHPWRFIKIEDWLCGGFAHTRGTFIILSQKHIDHLKAGWSQNMTEEDALNLVCKFGSLLVHEQLHSLQRTYKSKFIELYTEYWNFHRAQVVPDSSIVVKQVSNPDAPMAEWLIPNNSDSTTFYWIRTVLKDGGNIPVMGKDFNDQVYSVVLINGEYVLKRDESGKVISMNLEDFKQYSNSFPVDRGLDHPNEISAYMFSEYFQALVKNITPFEGAKPEEKANTDSFLSWIKS